MVMKNVSLYVAAVRSRSGANLEQTWCPHTAIVDDTSVGWDWPCFRSRENAWEWIGDEAQRPSVVLASRSQSTFEIHTSDAAAATDAPLSQERHFLYQFPCPPPTPCAAVFHTV